MSSGEWQRILLPHRSLDKWFLVATFALLSDEAPLFACMETLESLPQQLLACRVDPQSNLWLETDWCFSVLSTVSGRFAAQKQHIFGRICTRASILLQVKAEPSQTLLGGMLSETCDLETMPLSLCGL